MATANSAASAAPCQTKCSRVQPSVRISSGEIQCAKFVMAFSLGTHRAGGATLPALSLTFAGPPARESSIRWRSPQRPVSERHLPAAVSFRLPADKLRRRGHAGLRFCAPCLWRSLFARVSERWCSRATSAREGPRGPRARWRARAPIRREGSPTLKPWVSGEFPGSCEEAITKTFVLSTKIFVLLSGPLWPLAGIFAEDFLEHFALHQVLEGEVFKPRLGVLYQHLAVFHLGFLCNPAVDVEHVFRPGRFLLISLNELDLLMGDDKRQCLFLLIRGYIGSGPVRRSGMQRRTWGTPVVPIQENWSSQKACSVFKVISNDKLVRVIKFR